MKPKTRPMPSEARQSGFQTASGSCCVFRWCGFVGLKCRIRILPSFEDILTGCVLVIC
ncbi:hypothetical protein NEIPOLOT_01813 [Neisseria polysaccharea ATCC 43768]|nr:hypothetical protein NEIPOLOT_01813 [Neisseria polysaccharea ATCC 43768]